MRAKRYRDGSLAVIGAGNALIRFDGVEEQVNDDLLKFEWRVEMDDVHMRIVIEYNANVFFVRLIVSELNGVAHSLRERE